MDSTGPIMAAYWGSTHIHPLALAIIAVVISTSYAVERRWVPVCLLPALLLIAGGQRVVVGGVDFGVLRLLGLFVLLRFGARGEFLQVRWAAIDIAALGVAVLPAICAVLRGDSSKLMMSLGMGFDFFSMYLIGRVCLTDAIAWKRLALGIVVYTCRFRRCPPRGGAVLAAGSTIARQACTELAAGAQPPGRRARTM